MPRRNIQQPPEVELPSLPQVIHLTEKTPAPLFVGDYLKKHFWNMAKDLDKKYECSICLEEIDCQKGCERCFSLLTCGHIFHLGCIIRCQPMSCPLCRSSN
tara:strand:+ start:747 stop:1049 length:303 start_codon:yes stop_codon:yes gene_type:complete